VTLPAPPAPGSTFDGWSGDCTGTGDCVLPMYGDRDVTASFSVPPPPPPKPPGPPTNVTAVAGNGSVTVSWTPPADNGGSPITGYVVTSPVAGVSVSAGANATSVVVTGLTNGRGYVFGLNARNAAGFSSTANVGPVTPSAPPDPPTGVKAVAANGSATISWTAPAQNGGAPIAGYVVSALPGGATVEAGAAQTTAVVGGLTNGTSYTFTVVARNAAGTGAPSAPSNAVTPVTTPGVPTSVTARAGNGSATVAWHAPASDGGTAITGYTVAASPGGATTAADAKATNVVVKHLRNGVAYTFTVSARNAAGAGQASVRSNAVTPRAPVPRPKITRVTPARGAPGTTVTINGSGFKGASAVAFHSARATFRVVSTTVIKAIVPRKATTGRITVRTPGGTATSAHSFKVARR
jgi:fibronectin type III domain protein/IPT/TIG domain-containing protein/List-Bact-rpt repeat protein